MPETIFQLPRTTDAPDYRMLMECVHCGLCLPTCPTYAELGVEMDSPRGRIYLMRAVIEGKLSLSDSYQQHISLCLGCRACETACPSGVQFGQLLEGARAQIEQAHAPHYPALTKWLRRLAFRGILPHPFVLRALGDSLLLYQFSGLRALVQHPTVRRWLPERLTQLDQLLPRLPKRAYRARLRELTPALGERRGRVGFVCGCVMPIFFAHVNDATVQLMAANGFDVLTPRAQRCCGALHAHAGEREAARRLARQNLEAFAQARVDWIVVNAAGCGAMLKEYHELLHHDPLLSVAAKQFSERVLDVSQFFARYPFRGPLGALKLRVAYDDACHLLHGQRVKEEPRRMLSCIPGLELLEVPESDWCCGSAGIYNLVHPELSRQILARKMKHIASVNPDVIATANPGCLIQLGTGAKQHGLNAALVHPIELLHRAYLAAMAKQVPCH
ncbi:MAG TPA: heterodisulfide reductase-related iron-sulfur binding cluster [Candidatus Tectomicrobia bacterium]|nr:heterodisulfide reductase-related iron-sulfur binding cluster [Candidatus Tectomicrobia bacterium]